MTIRYDGWLDISANVPTNAFPPTPKALWRSNDPRGKIGGVYLDTLRILVFSSYYYYFFFLPLFEENLSLGYFSRSIFPEYYNFKILTILYQFLKIELFDFLITSMINFL